MKLALSGLDVALWDIKAKAAGLPLYQLLGGRSRTGVMVYGHANGRDIAQTVEEVLRYKELGYKAIRAQSGVPGLEKVYGVGKSTMFYEPADADLPSEHDWSTEKYLRHTPQLFQAGVPVVLEGNCQAMGRRTGQTRAGHESGEGRRPGLEGRENQGGFVEDADSA